MMSERTMILVYDYDLFKASAGDKEAFTALFADLPDYVCLVFICDLIEYKPDAGTCWRPPSSSTAPRSNSPGRSRGIWWIGSAGASGLWTTTSTRTGSVISFSLCGDLMTGLISEIGKIGAYARHRVITREDIDAVATPQLDAVVFQLTDAITGGNLTRPLQ